MVAQPDDGQDLALDMTWMMQRLGGHVYEALPDGLNFVLVVYDPQVADDMTPEVGALSDGPRPIAARAMAAASHHLGLLDPAGEPGSVVHFPDLLTELARKGQRMRLLQNKYFREGRRPQDLSDARDAERDFDKAVAEVLEDKDRGQGTLFG